MQLPYLTGDVRAAFDAWLEGTLARYVPPLNLSELRKGIQAVSSLYVERRGPDIAAKAVEGLGKRAALATYYAALHFITASHAVEMLDPETFGRVRRVIDFGCGSGAAGAAVSRALPGRPPVTGIDRSGWAVDEARLTWNAFEVSGRAIRGEIPLAAPRCGPGDLMLFGWSIGELADDARGRTFRAIRAALHRGAALMIAEPLAGRIVPWWDDWAEELAADGVRDELVRIAIQRPLFVWDMDRAAGLDHQVVGARLLAGTRRAAQGSTHTGSAERTDG